MKTIIFSLFFLFSASSLAHHAPDSVDEPMQDSNEHTDH